MADNLAITPGAGASVATDDVAGQHYQYVKIADGTLDSTNKAIVDSSGALKIVPSGTVATAEVRASTATRSSVTAAAADTLILAANASRKDASVYNDSTVNLYVALGTAAASVTSFTVIVAPGGFYEVAYGYTGQIRGIWAAGPTGSARVTELT